MFSNTQFPHKPPPSIFFLSNIWYFDFSTKKREICELKIKYYNITEI